METAPDTATLPETVTLTYGTMELRRGQLSAAVRRLHRDLRRRLAPHRQSDRRRGPAADRVTAEPRTISGPARNTMPQINRAGPLQNEPN